MGVATSKRTLLELNSQASEHVTGTASVHRSHSQSQFRRWVCCQTGSDTPAQGPPSPRSGHTVCLVEGRVYLFGGCGRAAGVDDYCLNDLHALDVETLRWEKIDPRSGERPAVRRSAAMCSIGGGRFLLSGGAGDDPDHLRSDLYMFDAHTHAWTKLLEGDDAKPFCLCGQSAVLWRRKVLFFGGSTGLEYSNELFSYDLGTNRWQQLATSGPRPTPRYKHQAFVHGDYMYVVGGGCFKPLCEDTDVHRLDLITMNWETVTTRGVAPMARVAHTCAYDSAGGGAVYMWGGFTAGLQCLRNFYKLSLDTHVWTAITPPRDELPPSARSFHGSVFTDGCVYILSGSNGSEKFSDVWRFTVRETPPPLVTLAARAVLANPALAPFRKSLSAKASCSAAGECGRRRQLSEGAVQPAPVAGQVLSKWQAHTPWPFSSCEPHARAPLSQQAMAPVDVLPVELVHALSHMNTLAHRIV